MQPTERASGLPGGGSSSRLRDMEKPLCCERLALLRVGERDPDQVARAVAQFLAAMSYGPRGSQVTR